MNVAATRVETALHASTSTTVSSVSVRPAGRDLPVTRTSTNAPPWPALISAARTEPPASILKAASGRCPCSKILHFGSFYVRKCTPQRGGGTLFRYVTNYPGRLSLLPSVTPWDGKMSTSQRAVMLCSWGVKAGVV